MQREPAHHNWLCRASPSPGALAWNADQLSSGSRDRVILQRDTRAPPLQSERRLQGHRQEVCGLKWSTDHQLLASGGNDNKVSRRRSHSFRRGGRGYEVLQLNALLAYLQLLVWNHSSVVPVQQYTEHLAAVKAIAWSPHQHGLLASGGGTADRCIRFWNTLTGQPLQCTDTGSQVCNLAWSKHTNELVSLPPIRCSAGGPASPQRFISASLFSWISGNKAPLCFSGEHTWIFSEPDPGVEVSFPHPSGQTHRTFIQSSLPGKCAQCLHAV